MEEQKIVLRLSEMFELIDRLYNFQSEYKFEAREKWGTEFDWKAFLNKSPHSSSVQNFVKMLVSLRILIPNRKIKKRGKTYQTYKLRKDWKKRLRLEVIEMTPEYLWLDKHYQIYNA